MSGGMGEGREGRTKERNDEEEGHILLQHSNALLPREFEELPNGLLRVKTQDCSKILGAALKYVSVDNPF